MAPDDDTEIEDPLEDDPEEVIPLTYGISSYGADYPVDSLVKRLDAGSIFKPHFQRSYVWPLPRASRFVESLLLGLPVPGIFLSKEDETEKLLIVDGQQRLRTLQYFYAGIFEPTKREFALEGVQGQFRGSTYRGLPDNDRRKLDDAIIHATIIKQDEPSEDNSSVYHVFERLNTGGMPLTAQEIRACIFHGEFNDLIRDLNDNKQWRVVFGKPSERMRDQELILRFLALYFDGSAYKRKPMKGFLNRYMGRNRHLKRTPEADIRGAFERTVAVVAKALGRKAFRPRATLVAAVYDAVMVGVARRLDRGDICDLPGFRRAYRHLLKDRDFELAVRTETSAPDNVRRRIQLAEAAFASVPS